MLKFEDLFVENDAVHADLVRAICLIEEALAFLKNHETLTTFKDLLETYRETMVARADSLSDTHAEAMKDRLNKE